MEEKYVVELTKRTVDEIADICELAAITLAKRQDVCLLWTYYAGLLRTAQPVQPSALQRLEEWAEQQTTGYVRIRSVWLESAEPVEDGFAWADDDGDYTSMELSDWRQKIHADYANSRISGIFTLPDNIRLCRLVSQEA